MATSTVTSTIVEVPIIEAPYPIPASLKAIAVCESGGTQFDSGGDVIRGRIDPDDTGLFQINLRSWGAESKRLGYDLETRKGNILMAEYIMKTQGLSAWSASKYCWGKV